MTRGHAAAEERDLHALFTAWLEGGAGGEPPRAAAVHAAHCLRCRAAMTALDHLYAVDVGRAPMPPSRGVMPEHAGPITRPRLVAAAASGFVVVAAAAWIGIGAIAPGLFGPGTAGPHADQEVLGGFGAGGSEISEPTPAVSLGGVTSQSGTPEAGSETEAPTSTPSANATPVFVATPVPTQVQPLPTDPPPSVPKSTPPTASPTKVPTPTPATPTPNPTPVPECSDGIDNDGDTLIDYGLDPLVNDPECLSPDDDDEGDLP